MLQHLSVKNYALIDKLELSLEPQFSVITGETGAGKSIILGALGLILGKRADLKALRNPEVKCVVEGTFLLNKDRYTSFFQANDLDFEVPSIIRREITPSGKSRAFINDTPVTLSVLNELAQQIIDVHSQHQNLLLTDTTFQLQLIDSYAKNESERTGYYKRYLLYREAAKELQKFNQQIDSEDKDVDYLEFLFNELKEAKLEPDEQEHIEEELRILENSEEIMLNLNQALKAVENEEGTGVSENLRQVLSALQTLKSYQKEYVSLAERVESVRIEVDDIRHEIEAQAEAVESDPEKLEKLDNRLSLLIHLQKKHSLDSVEALIEKRDELGEKLDWLGSFEEKRTELQQKLAEAEEALRISATELSKSRKEAAPAIEQKIESLLADLKMADARFIIFITESSKYTASGADNVNFLFSANTGQKEQALNKIASGGEMSRVMLALKSIMAEKNELPSIIFDEIDTGVSGETAGKVGQILRNMGGVMQVLAITHLPQIASMGKTHYKVLKSSAEGNTTTQIVKLSEDERLKELARLLSGEEITDAALANARNLLAHA